MHRIPRILLVLALWCGFAGCKKTRAPASAVAWPAFVGDAASARALLSAMEQRKPVLAAPKLDGASLWALLQKTPLSRLQIGWPAIHKWVGEAMTQSGARHRYLLWGTYHDSALQIEAFERLIRPGAMASWDRVVLEFFHATGAWRGVPKALQWGDDRWLQAYHSRGKKADWRALYRRQVRQNYTGWKYGYLSQVMRILEVSRAAGQGVSGCDMPQSLQQKLSALASLRPALRELHCALAVRQKLRPNKAARIAMLWGMAHVEPGGFRRWIPARDRVLSLYAIGGRPSPLSPAARLAAKVVLFAPVLLPLDPEQALLFLPDRRLGGQMERVRAPQTPGQLRSSSTRQGQLWLGEKKHRVSSHKRSVAIASGCQGYVWSDAKLRMYGSFCTKAGQGIELFFEPEGRSATTTLSP